MEYRIVFTGKFSSYELYSDWISAEEARDTFEDIRRNSKELRFLRFEDRAGTRMSLNGLLNIIGER